MKKIVLFPVFILILLGCKSSSDESTSSNFKTIAQNLPGSTSSVDLTNFLEIAEVIKLNTTDSSIIDFVNKVLIDGDLVFIKGGNSVFKFDKQGNFLSKLSKKGGGPDEYTNLTDLILLPEQKKIWIYDSNQRAIFQYTYDFEYEFDYALSYPLFGLEKMDNGLVGTGGYLNVLDKFSGLYFFAGDDISKGYEFSKSELNFNPEKSKYLHIDRHDHFSKTNNGFNFVNSFNDTIYKISPDFSVAPEFFIDFGNKKVTEEELVGKDYTSIVDVFQYINSTEKSFNVGNIVNLEKVLLYNFFNQGRSFLSLFDKSSDKLSSGQKILFNYQDKTVIVDFVEEISFGSIGNNQGYMVLPSEYSVMGDSQSIFNFKDGDNPIILIFNEK
jgi:hypothetical protein